MLAVLVAAIFALPAPQDGCIVYPEHYDHDTHRRPLQASGDGLWIGGVAFGPDDIASADPTRDDPTDQWTLTIRFTPQGNGKFLRAQRCGVGKPIEISVDGQVLSQPILNEEIAGGTATISSRWQDRGIVEALATRITQR